MDNVEIKITIRKGKSGFTVDQDGNVDAFEWQAPIDQDKISEAIDKVREAL